MSFFSTSTVWAFLFMVAVLTLLLSFRTYVGFRLVEDERTRRRRAVIGIVGAVLLVGLVIAIPIFMTSMPGVP